MDKKDNLKSKLDLINIYCFYLLAFSIPFGYHFKNIFFIIPGAILLIKLFLFKEKLVFAEKAVLGILLSYYLFHLVGLLYSDNLDKGISNLQKKFVLFFIPLLVNANIRIINPRMGKILFAYIAGVSAAMVVCLVMATVQFWLTGETQMFFYHDLGSLIKQHATYFSIEVALSSLLIIFYLTENYRRISAIKKTGLFVLLLGHQIFLLLLSSKSVILVYCLIINFLLIFYFSRKSFSKAIGWMVFFNLVLGLTLFSIPQTKSRFKEILSTNFEAVTQTHYTFTTKFTALTFRATIWKFLLQRLNESNNWLLGEGTGDWQQVLEQEYVKNNVFLGIRDQRDSNGFLGANAHNQYFQTLLMLGVVGLALLLLAFFVPLAIAVKRKNYLFLVFITFIIFCSLIESILETSKCLLFYAFFNSLLFFGNPKSFSAEHQVDDKTARL